MQRVCSICGSELIETTKTVKTVGNSQFPMTVTSYRCTNDVCQAEKDKKVADANTLRLEREAKLKERIAAKKSESAAKAAASSASLTAK